MPDKDEFEPVGRKWKSVYDDYASGEADTQIAEKALDNAIAMLQKAGGCEVLPDLSQALWDYQTNIAAGGSPREAIRDLQTTIDGIARTRSNERISMIALRSTRITAIQIKEGIFAPADIMALQTQLARQVIKELICHSFLDIARADSLGREFRTPQETRGFYDSILSAIDRTLPVPSQLLAQNPTGQQLDQLLPQTHRTKNLAIA